MRECEWSDSGNCLQASSTSAANSELPWTERQNCDRALVCFSGVSSMHSTVACRTKRDQIFLRVCTRVTPEFLVVYLQIGDSTTRLTPPIVTTQHFLLQCLVGSGIQPQPAAAHAATSLMLFRNSCFWPFDRNRKNLFIEKSSISGSPLSKLAPARKSAQIISRQ